MRTSERFVRRTVGDAMHELLVTCEPDTPLDEVAARLARHRIHCVIVVDPDADSRAPWALVSDLDLAAAAIDGIEGRVAREISATPVLTVTPDEPLWRAAQLMTENQNPHLVVTDPATSRPVGIVSTLDVAREVASASAF